MPGPTGARRTRLDRAPWRCRRDAVAAVRAVWGPPRGAGQLQLVRGVLPGAVPGKGGNAVKARANLRGPVVCPAGGCKQLLNPLYWRERGTTNTLHSVVGMGYCAKHGPQRRPRARGGGDA